MQASQEGQHQRRVAILGARNGQMLTFMSSAKSTQQIITNHYVIKNYSLLVMNNFEKQGHAKFILLNVRSLGYY